MKTRDQEVIIIEEVIDESIFEILEADEDIIMNMRMRLKDAGQE